MEIHIWEIFAKKDRGGNRINKGEKKFRGHMGIYWLLNLRVER